MRKLIRDNYRVVVVPESLWMGVEDEVTRIRDQIIRHVDVNKRSVSVEWDQYAVCEFCTRQHPEWRWEVDEDGCPTCCDKALEEWELSRKEALQGSTL